MKKLLALVLSMLTLLSGCAQSPEPAAGRALLVDGVVYLDTGRQVPVEVATSAILGCIQSSTGDLAQLPTQNRQSNFGCVGTEYAYLSNTFQEEGLVVAVDGEWTFFAAQLDKGADYTPPSRSAFPLNHAAAPDFPTLPQYTEDADYSAYAQALDDYDAAVQRLRGDGVSTQTARALADFAAHSVPLVLEGREGQNALCSPLSLWYALAILAQSAGGESREQALSALGVQDITALQEQADQLWRGLYTDNGTHALLLGSSVWLNNSLADSYIQQDALAQKYHTGVYCTPMGAPADQAVTNWISRQTKGLIGSDQPVVQTQADTLALLVSALYYRDGWLAAFAPGRTSPESFTAADGSASTAEFMHQTHNGTFFVQDGYQAASLYTELGRMIFLLPDQGTTPEQLLQNPQLFSDLLSGHQKGQFGQIQWSVPKFDLSGQLDLIPALERLGMGDLLDPSRADLSNLSSTPAYIGGAEQLARVKVDEEGLEAAAVTILTVPAADAPEPVCVMDLNHPFLFILAAENIPLFVGVVNQL